MKLNVTFTQEERWKERPIFFGKYVRTRVYILYVHVRRQYVSGGFQVFKIVTKSSEASGDDLSTMPGPDVSLILTRDGVLNNKLLPKPIGLTEFAKNHVYIWHFIT